MPNAKVKEIINYVEKNSSFQATDDGDDYVSFTTRAHGDTYHEKPSPIDYDAAQSIGSLVFNKFGTTYEIETVDEWTDITFKFNVN